jgi:hypothetical protein
LIKEKNILNIDNQILEIAKLLLNYRRIEANRCNFPSKIIEKDEWEGSGIGWCYGDLTIAYALLKTGILLDIKEYKELSLSILRETIHRDDYHNTMILCHGHVSNALIYSKIYELTKEKYFQDIAKRWKSLANDLFKKQYNSFIEKKEYTDFFNDPSLFYGFPSFF